MRGSKGSLTREINVGPCLPNFEKFRNFTSPSKVKGIASCLMIFEISSTSDSCEIKTI